MNFVFSDYKPHYRSLIQLGTPLIIGQIGFILQNFADTLMIGHHSTIELAAASLVSNIFILGILMSMGFALCLTPVIGKLYGQEKTEEIGGMIKNGLAVNTLAAVVLMMVYTLLFFFLDRLGQPEELLPFIRPYYIINLVSLPFICWLNCFKQAFDATTDTKTPMWILLGGNALNILGNWLLIYGKLGCPELGLVGAGISTLIARVLMFALIALFFFFSAKYHDIRTAYLRLPLNLRDVRMLIGLGIPISLQMGMESGAWALCSIIVGWIGTSALAGHQVMLTISQLFFQFYYALAAAVSIRISHFHGQHDYTAIHRTAWAGCHLNFLIAIIVAIPVFICRNSIGYLFTDSAEVAGIVASAIIPVIVYQFSDGLQITFSNALRGITYVKPMIFVAFISYFVVSIPLAYLFGIPLQGGLVGVWYSFPFGLTLAGIMYYYFYRQRLSEEQR
ncbi:MAG: MATE family efflux transporter [Prevotella sp.]|nr:MATE family efflux transporter [Prevotella sp.]